MKILKKKIRSCFLKPPLCLFWVSLPGNSCVRLGVHTALWAFTAVHFEDRLTRAPRLCRLLQALVHFRAQALLCAKCRSGRAGVSCRELGFGGSEPGQKTDYCYVLTLKKT